MTQVFHASTLFGVATLSAAIDAGLLGDRTGRRLLIVSDDVPIPELAPGFPESAAFAALRHRFDEVVSWNELIAPMHPSHWLPPDEELPMLSRLIGDRLGVRDGVTELVVESVVAAPGAAIATLLRDCPVTVYADSATSYGPTRSGLRPGIGRRVERLLHPELVAGVVPLMLREYDVDPVPIPATAFADVVASLPRPDVAGADGCPVIIGQALSSLGVLTEDEETGLLLDAVSALAARGETRIVFRPHAAQGRATIRVLRDEATRLGLDLVVTADDLPAEGWFAAARPSLVVSCFATALLTAAAHHGLQVASVGTDVVLQRLAPYEHELRMPATVVDACLPRLQPDGSLLTPPARDVGRLVDAVGYCMQADRLPGLREAAVCELAEHGHERYFKRRRLEKLGLLAPPPPAPAPPPPPPPPARVGRVARRLLAEARTVADKRRGGP